MYDIVSQATGISWDAASAIVDGFGLFLVFGLVTLWISSGVKALKDAAQIE